VEEPPKYWFHDKLYDSDVALLAGTTHCHRLEACTGRSNRETYPKYVSALRQGEETYDPLLRETDSWSS